MRDKYAKKHGKLIRGVPVVVDQEMESKIKEAKDNGFDFQAWARDLFVENFETVLSFCDPKKAKHA